MSVVKAEGQYVHQTSLEQTADFHASPESWDCLSQLLLLAEEGLDWQEGSCAVVICYR